MFKKLNVLVIALLIFTLIPIAGVVAESNDTTVDLPTTGFEDRNGESWTTLEEEIDFINEVAAMSDRIRVTLEGSSVLGKPIHLIRVGNPLLTDEEIANGRNIFIMGTPHGNEPAGREMSLSLIRDLAFTDDPEMLELLSKSTILFMPTPNPDGRQDNRRTNEWRLDNNRDNLNLTSPENEIIAGVLSYYDPDITVDLHERPTGTSPDIEGLWPRNLNVDEDLRALNVKLVEEYVFPSAEADGWTTGLYGRPGGSGGEDERILRNVGGLRNGLALLTESAGRAPLQDRADMQRSVMNGAIAFYQDHFDEIAEVRAGAKERRTADGIDPSVPFYLDGADNWAPTMILENKPMGYLLTKDQANTVSKHINLFNIQTEDVDNGVFASMHQPMMTILPLLFDERAKYNEISALPVYSLSNPGTAANLIEQIEHFKNVGAFSSPVASRTLSMHASAVDNFEKADQADKVVKHMETFKLILDQYKATNIITDEAYDNLTAYADFLIEKWTTPELPQFDSARAMEHLQYLAVDLGSRPAGSDGEKQAAAYIQNEFESLGYDVSIQEFNRGRSGDSQNVIAVKKPQGVDNPEIVYLMAHYDSVAVGPGANDNGSGTSGLLEFARIFKDIQTDKEIRFLAVGAEEVGLVGSRYYVDQLSQDEIDRSIANFNMDMIGTIWEPATQLFVNVVDGNPNTVWEYAKAASDKLGLEDDKIRLYQRGASDHVPFFDVGIPAANFIWREPGTASLEPWYHTAEDTIDKVSPEKIQFVGDLLQVAITDLLNQ